MKDVCSVERLLLALGGSEDLALAWFYFYTKKSKLGSYLKAPAVVDVINTHLIGCFYAFK